MHMRSIVCGVVAVVIAIGAAGPAAAQGKGKGKGKGHGEEKHEGHDVVLPAPAPGHEVSVRFGFAPHDREIIRTYYVERPAGLPPGLAKHLARNGTLPPGLQKKLVPLPVVLERQLVPLPSGYRRAIYGPDVIVYRPSSGVVVDVLIDIVH